MLTPRGILKKKSYSHGSKDITALVAEEIKRIARKHEDRLYQHHKDTSTSVQQVANGEAG